jgi:hypothetical protein
MPVFWQFKYKEGMIYLKKSSKKMTAGFLSLLMFGINNIFNEFGGKFDFSNIFSQSVSAQGELNMPNPWEIDEVIKVLDEENKIMVNSVKFKNAFAGNYELLSCFGEYKDEPTYNLYPFDFSSEMKKKEEAEKIWEKRVTAAPVVLYENGGLPRPLVLDVPRQKALRAFHRNIVMINPGKSDMDVLSNLNFRETIDKLFGKFTSHSASAFVASTAGANIEEISASARLHQILFEEGMQNIKLMGFKAFDFAKKHPIVPIFALSLLFFNSAQRMAKSIFSAMQYSYKNFRQRFLYNRLRYSSDPEEMMAALTDALNEKIIDQQKAIFLICRLITGWLMARKTKGLDKKIGPLLIVLAGSSGLGKTLTCRLLSKAIFGMDMDPSQFITNHPVLVLSKKLSLHQGLT